MGIVCHVLVDANGNQETVTIFPSSIRSERDLPECNSTSTVCSLLQKRYWLPFQLYRYCRCPSGSGGCPSDWVVPGGDVTVSNTTASESILTKFGSTFSLMMNDRAQFKFCSSVNEVETCKPDQTAVVLQKPIGFRPVNETDEEFILPPPTTKVTCKCPAYHKWVHTTTDESFDESTGITSRNSNYNCQPLERCRLGWTCGRVTRDTYTIYHQCSCKRGQMCILNHDRSLHNIKELLYNGPAYFAKCHGRSY